MQSNEIKFIKLNDVTTSSSSSSYLNTTLKKQNYNNSETMLNKQIDDNSKTLSEISLKKKNEGMITFTAAMNSMSPHLFLSYDDVLICPDWLSLESVNWVFFGPKSYDNNRNNSNFQIKSTHQSYSNISSNSISDTISRSSSSSDNLSGSGRISI